ncbi:hypothetical protein EXIGLDRAFT_724156 [Exidia glandulosa HHB12029]|uniref:F-box domain-containing protein n=1 Tax=Exidia glandulosa HHB12029 TaxID=1314781 RepID=A0A165EII8_EXIGL|nr:hypothetical protein EXIGLDRAFT_724156 [Exidia glandulosa HHB12029]
MASATDDSVPSTHQSALLAELAVANAEAEGPREQHRVLQADSTVAQERLLAADATAQAAVRALNIAREDLRSAKSDLKSTQKRCEGAEIIKSSAEAKIEFVQERLQLYTRQPDVLSPVGHLPGEIVIQIFDYSGTNRPTNALRLSHVNRRWRNLALNTAFLWTTLDSYYGPGAAHAFVARAGQLPLSIAMTYGPGLPSYDRPYTTFRAFVYVAAHYAHRWSKIHITACSRSAFESAFACVTDAVNASAATLPLRVTSVSMNAMAELGRSAQSTGILWGYQSNWPFLAREVILTGLPRVPAACLAPDLDRLELHYGPHSPELFDMASVFRAPDLKTLILDIYGDSAFLELGSDVETRRTLPSLRTLHVKGLDRRVLFCFLFRTAMPALRHIDMTLTGTCTDVMTIIKALMTGLPIEDLRIHRTLRATGPSNMPLPSGGKAFLENITPSLPMLTRLRLESVQLRDNTLMELSIAMPRLETLQLCMEENVTINGLREIVHERRRESNSTELQCLEIICCSHLDNIGDWTDIVQLVPTVVRLRNEDEEDSNAGFETDSEIDAVLDDDERAFLNL